MSRDIRSYFIVSGKSRNDTPKQPEVKVKKSKKTVLIDSDDDDCVKGTPESKPKIRTTKRGASALSSDSEDEPKNKSKRLKAKTTENAKLKPVNINDIFNKTVKQSKVEYTPKPDIPPEPDTKSKVNKNKKTKHKSTKNTEIGIHDDEDFEKTLLELDDDVLINSLNQFDQSVDEALEKDKNDQQTAEKTNIIENTSNEKKKTDNLEHDQWSPEKNIGSTPSKKKKIDHLENVQHSAETTIIDDTPKKKKKRDTLDVSIDTDQEKYERKRHSAALYQKYLHRGGPKHHGMKELPKGKPNCLKNLTFLRTGVLDSLESDEFENLIIEHGGRVVHAVSKKVSYVVVGEDAGPAKLAKAENYKIPQISEDELLDIILVKSGMKSKFVKTNSNDTDDTGIETGSSLSFEKDGIDVTVSPKKCKKEIKKQSSSPKKHDEKHRKSSPSPKKIREETKNNTEEFKCESSPSTKVCKHELETAYKVNAETETHKKVKVEKQVEEPVSVSTKSNLHDVFLPWTEKYRPSSIKAIIGQQDSNSNMNKLKNWLGNWYTNQSPDIKAKLPRPSPWNQYDGAYFKCALLSGSPGVGKTTTASLVAKELGYDVVEFNASDTRSKKLLHEEVSQLLHNTTIAGYAAGKPKTDKKRVLLMDEVDGMAGNEDRGGMQELISLIKSTNIPIICMCNDRNHQKMRTLVTYCYDLRFSKPPLKQIMGAMLSICFKEGIKIRPEALCELIAGTGCDVRQTLNHLSMWSAADSDLSIETVQKESKASHKDVVLGTWDIVKKVFNESENKDMSLGDRSRLFFYDYSMGPLFIQENYIHAVPNCKSDREKMIRLYKAADSLSIGDKFETKIRSSNNWSLLDSQSYFSCAFPGYYMSGTLKSVNFPSWLGKNSKKNKFYRMLGELHVHTRTCTSGSKLAMRMDYLVPLRNAIINPLKKRGAEGIPKAVGVMKDYNLLREDLNNLVEMCHWSGTKNPFNDIDTKVKSAFTRAYNKEAPLLPFSAQSGVSKKRMIATESDLIGDEEDQVDSDAEEDDLNADSMIKVKGKKEAGKKESGKKETANTNTKKTKNAKPKGKGSK